MLHGAGPLTFGANNVWGEHFQGLIDEIRIYNRRADAPTRSPPTWARRWSRARRGRRRDTDPTQVGQFAAPQCSGRSCPVHLALLSNGKVAAWDGFEAALNSEHTWDPWTRQFDADPDRPQPVLRRPHHAAATGACSSPAATSRPTRAPRTRTCSTRRRRRGSAAPDMAEARWYPTATALPDGRVFVVSGDNVTLGRTRTRTRRCR